MVLFVEVSSRLVWSSVSILRLVLQEFELNHKVEHIGRIRADPQVSYLKEKGLFVGVGGVDVLATI